MSLYKSLKELNIKLQHKNIVICSGNINEIIPVKSKLFQQEILVDIDKTDNENEFISLIEFIKNSNLNNFEQINTYSSVWGVETFPKKNENNAISDSSSLLISDYDENDDDTNNDKNIGNIQSLNEHIINITNEVRNSISEILSGSKKPIKKLFIINCSDVILTKESNELTKTLLSKLFETFVDFKKTNPKFLKQNKIKLVLICRKSEPIEQSLIDTLETSLITIVKPDNEERKEFFKMYSNRFDNLKDSVKDADKKEFREAISLTTGCSFREFYQYARVDLDEKYTFPELYNLLTFKKKESEWEKIDQDKMVNIEQILSKRVKGQNEAIKIAKTTLIRSFMGMNGILHSLENNNKPKGCLFLVGPTGVGKTELAKSIAEFVFGDEKRIIRFDMSEYNHDHSDQRLIGAPPGYVGFENGGQLTNAVKDQPFTILLFDEIEKASGKILDKFLQVLEDGRLTSGQGETIDFSQTFIIFTSNIGAATADASWDEKKVKNHFKKEVKDYFTNQLKRPEILNRIGEKNIVPFQFITDRNISKEIIKSKLSKLEANLSKEKNIKLKIIENFDGEIFDKLIDNIDPNNGGRGVINLISDKIIDPLSHYLMETINIWKYSENYTNLEMYLEDNKILKFRFVD